MGYYLPEWNHGTSALKKVRIIVPIKKVVKPEGPVAVVLNIIMPRPLSCHQMADKGPGMAIHKDYCQAAVFLDRLHITSRLSHNQRRQ
jgi:hypothetical protein